MAQTLPLTNKITNKSTKKVKNRILEAKFGDGYRQVANDGLNSSIDTWKIQYAPLSGAELATLDTFLSSVGVTNWFTWVPIGETITKKWRIDKDSINRKLLNTSTYMVSFSITQCFDLG